MDLEIEIKKEEDQDYFDIHRGEINGFVDKDLESNEDSKNIGNNSNDVEENNNDCAVVNGPVVDQMNIEKPQTQDARQTKEIDRNKRFQCQECSKYFTRRCYLSQHQDIVHKGLKLFQCDECGKSFSCNSSLTAHKKTVHKGLKPFQCQE